MAKEKTLWKIILDIFSYLFNRKKKKSEEQEENLIEVQEELKEDYKNIEYEKKKKQDDQRDDIKDISDRINNSF